MLVNYSYRGVGQFHHYGDDSAAVTEVQHDPATQAVQLTDPTQPSGPMTFWQLVGLHVAVSLVAATVVAVAGHVFFKRRIRR